MITGLRGRTRRVLALILLGVFIMMGASAIALPLWLRERQNMSVMIIEARIEETKQRLIEQASILDELDERESVDELGLYLLSAPTVSLAAVELARDVGDLFEKTEGIRKSTEILDPVRIEPIWQVGVRLRATIDVMDLRELLYNIENNVPWFYVRQLFVQRVDKGRTSRELDIEIVVNGYTRM